MVSIQKLFAYNRSNLLAAKRMRGANRIRFLRELEFQRTHTFKSMPRKDNKSFGRWVLRKNPIKKIIV